MKKTILLVFGFLSGATALFSSCDTTKYVGVQFDQIKGWKAVGTRWAQGYDAQGKLIAIYDLSFPDWWQQVNLGIIGARKVTVQDAIDTLQAALSNPSPVESGSGSTAGTTDAPSSAIKSSADALIQALTKYESTSPLLDVLPDGWWKNLPWRNGHADFAASDTPPQNFTLDDLDLEALATSKTQLDAKIAELENTLDPTDNTPLLGNGFLKNFHFVAQSDGSYAVSWAPTAAISGYDPAKSQPKKLIDFGTPTFGIVEGAAWQAVEGSISGLLGLIPERVVSTLLKTALGEFSHAHEQLLNDHYDMLVELATLAQEGDAKNSPFAALGPDQVQAIGSSIEYSETSLALDPLWLFKSPVDQWKNDRKQEIKQAGASTQWLQQQMTAQSQLNPRFGWAVDKKGDRQLYSLAHKAHLFSSEPELTIDYGDPCHLRTKRDILQGITLAIHFGSNFIPVPFGSSVLNGVWDAIVQSPMDLSRRWEARLKSTLWERQAASQEDWKNELSILDGQTANRLEPTEAYAAQLIQQRLQLIGLGAPTLAP